MYRCYESSGNEDEAVNVLKDILSYDENYEDAVKALADIYYKREIGRASCRERVSSPV